MANSLPDYVLIAELLGFGTGTVLAVLLYLLVRRSAWRSPGTRLLTWSALLWNVFGLITYLMLLGGAQRGSWPFEMCHATYLSGGALFPVSFLQLWERPSYPASWRSRAARWLLEIARCSAALLIPLMFACVLTPDRGLNRFTTYAVTWNASILLTSGAFIQVKGRLKAASDRIYLTLTLVGVWACTASILLLDRTAFSPRVEAALVVAKEQSPFLAILGALFFFARFRSSDVLIKFSLRVVAAASVGIWAFFFIARSLPKLSMHLSVFPRVAQAGVGAALIAALLLLFGKAESAIGRCVDRWILRQPDFRETLVQLWERMAQIDSEAELFATAERVVAQALGLRAARVLNRADFPAVETHAAANAGRLWELSCDDACRRLLESELTFLRSVAGQLGRRLEALAHQRETIERQSREARLRQLAAQAELKALRAQINPHFLFNSLNTIAELIVTDPGKAETMTLLLSKVFRHVLMHTDRPLTRVEEEMEFLRTYLGIEQVRFGPRLSVKMQLDPAVSQDTIPSLILQPVVENAIKHGLAPKIGVGSLSITAERQGEFVKLAVEDDGVGAAAPRPPAANNGLGLKIIAERLRTLYHGRASLEFEAAEAAGSRVTILIPRSGAAAV